MKDQGFETRSVRMERLLQVHVLAPEEDADRDNPHRWWNTTGDWNKQGATE